MEDTLETDESYIRNRFIQIALISVLNDCLEQFYILKSLNLRNALVFNEDAIEYKSISERFTGVENHEDTRIPCVNANYDKITVDINNLINIIKETFRELDLIGTFTVLEKRTDAIKRMCQDERALIKQKQYNEKKILVLQHKLEEERINNIRTIEETDQKIEKLRLEVENAIVYGRLERSYYNKWERTRIEQNNITCKNNEQRYDNIIDETKDKLDLEFKCHREFSKFIEEDKNDCMDKIAYWVKKYDEEIDNRETEMINMKAMLEEMSLTHARVIEENEKRKKEMADWIAYKNNKKRAKAREKDIKWASLIIQTWWRAMMTRKGIGPYKTKRKVKK
ncbi:uncharacterized protein LOC130897257 [Diorhabda carinulata]|uniref:uncharacterized protein LOC130897257 n=1 Tax=Diorhabda carinulata TaxID=1163345 RepID=UPI0025A25F3B|nr:uncharacterized protein LOC130897257 [Diorhabda carinulata]